MLYFIIFRVTLHVLYFFSVLSISVSSSLPFIFVNQLYLLFPSVTSFPNMLQTKSLAFLALLKDSLNCLKNAVLFSSLLYLNCKCYDYFHLVMYIDLLPSLYSAKSIVTLTLKWCFDQ